MTNVSWGSYRNYEGPYFRGTQSFKKYAESVEEPNAKEKILRVFTATEGGRFDAINMYDRCIISVGLIQFCEAGIWAVSDMLGFTAEQAGLSEEFLAQLERPDTSLLIRFEASGDSTTDRKMVS